MGRPRPPERLARPLHPGAWWLWALGLAVAASRTTNPLLLVLLLAVLGLVVAARRSDAPWARGFAAYLVVGLVVIVIRVVFRMLLSSQHGGHVLFTLPQLPLPDVAAGIRLGGPVSAEGLLAALDDGLQLAALLICLGAANVLTDPKRLLKSVPGALHEIGTALIVALSVAPQLVESGQRIQRARRLRGGSTRRRRVLRQVFVPLLADALDRSISLAAAMESRGYGRVAAGPRTTRRVTGAIALAGLVGVCAGTYGLLDGTAPWWAGAPMLVAGLVAAVAGVAAGSLRVQRSVYRPDPWRWEEWAVSGSGVACAALFCLAPGATAAQLNPTPLSWPSLAAAPLLGLVLACLPALAAPPAGPLQAAAAPRGARRGAPRGATPVLPGVRRRDPSPPEPPRRGPSRRDRSPSQLGGRP